MPKPDELEAMADLLRQGATLTELSCPACASPLFKLRSGKLWCAKCQKQVVVVKEGELAEKVTAPMHLRTLEATVLAKIQDIETKIQQENDPEQLQKLSNILTTLLQNLEKIRKMKST
ncbi:MAG: Sjogren's syndrome/scleroderma autoantigen 1 family protein [Candidatus Bathyarchaeota archaeon]